VISEPKVQKAVHACMIMLFNQGCAGHADAVIYAAD